MINLEKIVGAIRDTGESSGCGSTYTLSSSLSAYYRLENPLKKKNKYLNRAEWLTAAIGLFTGAIFMLDGGNIMGILYYSLTLIAPIPLTTVDYFIFARAFVTLIISGIMLTNTHKLRKDKTISKLPYFCLLFFLVVESTVAVTIGNSNLFELIYRSIIPVLTILALINLWKGKQGDSNDDN